MCLLEVNENEVSVRPVSYLLPPPINAPLWDKSFTDRRVNVIGEENGRPILGHFTHAAAHVLFSNRSWMSLSSTSDTNASRLFRSECFPRIIMAGRHIFCHATPHGTHGYEAVAPLVRIEIDISVLSYRLVPICSVSLPARASFCASSKGDYFAFGIVDYFVDVEHACYFRLAYIGLSNLSQLCCWAVQDYLWGQQPGSENVRKWFRKENMNAMTKSPVLRRNDIPEPTARTCYPRLCACRVLD